MKKKLLSGLVLLVGAFTFAQGPANAEPGKCYVSCTTPDVWKNETITVNTADSYKVLKAHGPEYGTEQMSFETQVPSTRLEVVPATFETKNVVVETKPITKSLVVVPGKKSTTKETIVIQKASTRLEIVPAQYKTEYIDMVIQPAYTKLEVIPAQYKTVKETVVTQKAYKKLKVIPAKWTTETLSYDKTLKAASLKVVPATFSNSSQTIVVKPATTKWVLGDKTPDCEDADPMACRVWCYTNVPEETVTITTRKVSEEAKTVEVPCGANANANGNCIGKGTYVKRVLAKPATTTEITIPEVTTQVTKTVLVKPATTRTITVPAVTKKIKTTVLVKGPSTKTITIPARTKEITKTMYSNDTTREVSNKAANKTIKTTVVKTPASVRTIKVDGKSKTFTKTVLAKKAWTTTSTVPGKTQNVTKQILVTKGGLKAWKEIDCKLANDNLLPINWNTGSATLTPRAKSLIDSKLMPILNKGIAVAIASHTDARGSAASNQRLSERRASAVVNYLISKGVNRSQLTGKGYGETRLTNRCADGVTCTEAEHKANRRTTFRTVNK